MKKSDLTGSVSSVSAKDVEGFQTSSIAGALGGQIAGVQIIKPDGTVNEEKMAGSGENMVSFNHYAFGSVGEFYYQYILGIRPEKPGFAKLHFAPYPDERLGGVSGSYLSVAGKIESAWRYEPDGCHIRLATPVEAVVLLPDGRSENVPAGTYEWTVKRP